MALRGGSHSSLINWPMAALGSGYEHEATDVESVTGAQPRGPPDRLLRGCSLFLAQYVCSPTQRRQRTSLIAQGNNTLFELMLCLRIHVVNCHDQNASEQSRRRPTCTRAVTRCSPQIFVVIKALLRRPCSRTPLSSNTTASHLA
ncbi:hypothetical protein PsYK624_107250 [Phanerochaete sordida]|uniref:Uncharacterized protein n=1 Tax=Phanerochaete sordida TaxID=48140 RepID=A0A9P3LGQ3_9APHY|nr:hypothetical protein PsYK624_107250 [Phanerochaete sordida]